MIGNAFEVALKDFGNGLVSTENAKEHGAAVDPMFSAHTNEEGSRKRDET
jgi:hypothetical protein